MIPATAPPDENGSRRWVSFSRDINLGHILTMLTFLGGLYIYGQAQDRRITILEQAQQTNAAQMADTKADIKEIKGKVTEISTNLAVQAAIYARPTK